MLKTIWVQTRTISRAKTLLLSNFLRKIMLFVTIRQLEPLFGSFLKPLRKPHRPAKSVKQFNKLCETDINRDLSKS